MLGARLAVWLHCLLGLLFLSQEGASLFAYLVLLTGVFNSCSPSHTLYGFPAFNNACPTFNYRALSFALPFVF